MDDGSLAETRAAFVAELERGDAVAAAAHYAENARLLAPSAELIEGRTAIAAFWRAGLDAGIDAMKLEVLDVERTDGFAYEIGCYTLQLDGDTDGVVERGKYVLVHERQPDGSWLRTVEMFNPGARVVEAVETGGVPQ